MLPREDAVQSLRVFVGGHGGSRRFAEAGVRGRRRRGAQSRRSFGSTAMGVGKRSTIQYEENTSDISVAAVMR